MAKIRVGIFGTVPIALCAARPTRAAVLAYIALSSFQGSSDACWPKIEQIALRANLNERETKRGVDWLRKAGWVETQRRYGRSSVYRVLMEAEIVTESDTMLVPESDTMLVPESGLTEKEQGKGNKEKEHIDALAASTWQAFLSKAGTFTAYAKERNMLNVGLKRMRKLYDDKTEAMTLIYLETFWGLKQSNAKFWKQQPFSPSAMFSSGIFDRLREEVEQHKPENDVSWVGA